MLPRMVTRSVGTGGEALAWRDGHGRGDALMFGESILRHRPGAVTGRDGNGNVTRSAATEATISMVAPAPGSLEEQAEPVGARSSDRWTLYCRSATPMDLLKDDLVTFRGESGWQVVGDARVTVWRSPYSHVVHGSVAEIRRGA